MSLDHCNPHHAAGYSLCVVYARISTDGQSTIPEQLRWAKELAAKERWTVIAAITDEGISGGTHDRDGLNEVIDLFESHHRKGMPITRLVVRHTDRLSRRDAWDTIAMLNRLRAVGLRFITTETREYDATQDIDRTMYSLVQEHQNHPFLKTIARRTLDGMADAVRQGRWVGRIPFGYRLERTPHPPGKRRRSGVLVIDEVKAAIVRELFERYDQGQSTTQLARWLSGQVSPPVAKAWSAVAIRGLLTSELYIGVRKFGEKTKGKFVRLQGDRVADQAPGHGRYNNPEAVFTSRDEKLAIVAEPLFRRVQEKLKTGRRRSYRRNTEPLTLSGLGKCGHCGGALHARWAQLNAHSCKDKLVRRLACSNRVQFGKSACSAGSTNASHDAILLAILKEVSGLLIDGNAAERIEKIATEQAGDLDQKMQRQRQALEKRVKDLDRAIETGRHRLLTVPEATVGDVRIAIDNAKAKRDDLQEELHGLDVEVARPAFDVERFKAFCSAAQKADGLVKAGTLAPSLRPLVAELIDSFTLYFGTDDRGRSTPVRVEIELPSWLSALEGSGTRSSSPPSSSTASRTPARRLWTSRTSAASSKIRPAR